MLQIAVRDRTIEVDELGFIVDPNDWNREVAGRLAESSSLGPLLEDHWRVITYVREYYEKHNTAPMLRAIIKRTKLKERELRTLFPSSCHECMCKIAGLPKGTG